MREKEGPLSAPDNVVGSKEREGRRGRRGRKTGREAPHIML